MDAQLPVSNSASHRHRSVDQHLFGRNDPLVMVCLDCMTNAEIVNGRTVGTSPTATHGWIFRSSLRMRDTRASMATSSPAERSTSYVMLFALPNGRPPTLTRTAGICEYLSHPGFVDTKRHQLACSEADDH